MRPSQSQPIKKILEKTMDIFLPPLCPATGEAVEKWGMVDAQYWKTLNFINGSLCTQCGSPFSFQTDDMICGDCLETPPTYNQNRSALMYDDASSPIILRYKHGDQTHAVNAFIPWLQQAGGDLLTQADIIMPVPLHYLRMIKRRYNQADLIGRKLSKYYPDKHYYPDGLIRHKHTQSQGHKSSADREKNIRDAFKINPRYDFHGKNILIIDDVLTSGSTLNECAKTLFNNGALTVNCLTLAKVVRQ